MAWGSPFSRSCFKQLQHTPIVLVVSIGTLLRGVDDVESLYY